jgi:hypothetical protein
MALYHNKYFWDERMLEVISEWNTSLDYCLLFRNRELL